MANAPDELSPLSDNMSELYTQGALLVKAHKFEQALKVFRHALTLEPDDAESLHFYGKAFQGLGRHKDAIEQFQKAVEIDTEFPEALADLGDSFREAGDKKAARQCYLRARDLLLPGEETWNQILEGLDKLGG